MSRYSTAGSSRAATAAADAKPRRQHRGRQGFSARRARDASRMESLPAPRNAGARAPKRSASKSAVDCAKRVDAAATSKLVYRGSAAPSNNCAAGAVAAIACASTTSSSWHHAHCNSGISSEYDQGNLSNVSRLTTFVKRRAQTSRPDDLAYDAPISSPSALLRP
jgi:hypothetical protein